MFWPCETRTSTCRNLATISSGLYRFLAITVLLDVKDIPQVGPLRWGLIMMSYGPNFPDLFRRAADYVDKISHVQLLCASVAVTTTLLERQIHGSRRLEE